MGDKAAAKILKAVEGLSAKFDGLTVKLDGLTHRFDGLSAKFDGLTSRVDDLTDSYDGLSSRVGSLSAELRTVSGSLTSLIRTVDRIDQRLVDVETYTVLIPGIADAVSAHTADIDDHQKRISKLEKSAA